MLNGEEQNIIGYPTRGNVFSSVIPSHFISITSFPFSLTLVIPGFPSSHSVLFDGGKSFVIFSLVFLSFSLPIALSLLILNKYSQAPNRTFTITTIILYLSHTPGFFLLQRK